MKLIRIYNKSFSRLLALTEQEFNGLTYKRVLGEIGDAAFTVLLGRTKMNDVNLNLYNRLEIYDEGVLKFTGIITQKVVRLDTADLKIREIGYILKKRLVGASYSLSGTVNAVAAQLLTDLNAVEATGITAGAMTGTGSVNLTFNNADGWTILKQICESTGNQFEITPSRQLVIKPQVGTDKSASVLFRYNADQVANANLLGFEIEDDGENIVTKAIGKSDALNSSQVDAGLQSSFGTLEKFRDFRVVNTQGVLDSFTAAEVADRVYSPRLVLIPNITDNFEVGDRVTVRLKNQLVNINTSYQILEKRIKYNGGQKMIEVRINDLPNYLVQKLADRDRRLELLEKEV